MPEHQKPGVLTIDSFKGGRTNYLDQTTIDASMCASASMNVWAPFNTLIPTPGVSLAASFTATAGTGFTTSVFGFWAVDGVSTANTLFYSVVVTSTGDSSFKQFPFGSSYTFTDSLTPLGYTVGTISISGGTLISATGSGTSWLANVSAGDRFQSSQNTNGWYSVNSIEDDTHLTLAAAIPTALATGTTYIIQPYLATGLVAESMLNGDLVLSRQDANMRYYNGTSFFRLSTTATGSAIAPKAAFMDVFQGYLFAAGSTAFPSRLFWSNLSNPTNWYINNFIDIDLLNNGPIMGLKTFGQELIVFKNRAMYKVIGNIFDPTNPTYFVQRIATPSDFIFSSNYSIAIHSTVNPNVSYGGGGINYSNNVLVFYATSKIYMYQQGTTFITKISEKIQMDLPDVTNNFTLISDGTDQSIRGFSYNGYYILKGLVASSSTISTPFDHELLGTSNWRGIIMDRNMSYWLLYNTASQGDFYDFLDNGPMAVVPSLTNRPQLVMVHAGTPTVFVGSGDLHPGTIFTSDYISQTQFTNYSQAGSGAGTGGGGIIYSMWVSKEFNIEYGTFNKIIVYLKKYSSVGPVTVQWSIDQGTAVSYNINMNSGRGQVIRAVIDVRQKGSTIQLALLHNVGFETFTVYGIKIYYTPSEDERLL